MFYQLDYFFIHLLSFSPLFIILSAIFTIFFAILYVPKRQFVYSLFYLILYFKYYMHSIHLLFNEFQQNIKFDILLISYMFFDYFLVFLCIIFKITFYIKNYYFYLILYFCAFCLSFCKAFGVFYLFCNFSFFYPILYTFFLVFLN